MANLKPEQLPEWEAVALNTAALKVPGGWLYKYRTLNSAALAFVPNPRSYDNRLLEPETWWPK